MSTDLRDYAVEEILRDGGSIHVRAIRPDDRERLVEHFHRLSERSVRFRFMGMKRGLSEGDLDYFTRPDFVHHIALVATLREGGAERIIGVGRYVADDEDPAAEVAFAVADEHQGRGIGTVLLEHLLRIARERGITEFRADVLGDNNQMLDVFRHSHLQVGRATDAGVIHLFFPTAETEESRMAAEARARQAAAESVRALLCPRSVALVGASTRPGTIGAALLTNLLAAGFRGPIYPVHSGAMGPVRSLGPPRSMRIRHSLPSVEDAARRWATIAAQASGPSWAQLIRMQFMPLARSS